MAHALCLSHCPCISHTRFCSPTHSPTYQLFTHSLIPFLTLLLHLSLSLSLVCTRERACVSLSPSFLSLSLLHSLSVFLSVSLFLMHSLTRAHRDQIFISIFLAHSHTFLSLSSSLSFSYIQKWTRTHICTLTLFYLFTRPPTHSLLSCLCAALSSARVRTRALSSLYLPPFLPFLFFAFLNLSLFLSSSPLARLLARRLSLTRSLPLVFNSW